MIYQHKPGVFKFFWYQNTDKYALVQMRRDFCGGPDGRKGRRKTLGGGRSGAAAPEGVLCLCVLMCGCVYSMSSGNAVRCYGMQRRMRCAVERQVEKKRQQKLWVSKLELQVLGPRGVAICRVQCGVQAQNWGGGEVGEKRKRLLYNSNTFWNCVLSSVCLSVFGV